MSIPEIQEIKRRLAALEDGQKELRDAQQREVNRWNELYISIQLMTEAMFGNRNMKDDHGFVGDISEIKNFMIHWKVLKFFGWGFLVMLFFFMVLYIDIKDIQSILSR